MIMSTQKLKIIWKRGFDLSFPDVFSRDVMINEYLKDQLQQKIPGGIEFFMSMVTQ